MATKMKYYFGVETAQLLAGKLGLDAEEYASWVGSRVDDLEIKDRVGVFALGLRDRLPDDYREALAVIVASFGPELAEGEGYFNHGFYWWPVGRFIEEYGLADPEASLDAIEALTRVFTGEWAVRPFLTQHHELTMRRVRSWAVDDSHNLRRLASEGIRPRLPWAPLHRPFLADPSPIIPILDQLHDDPSTYVRTSVANNLNDISRTHPELALDTVQRWLAGDDSERTRWVATRGLRTLTKAGHAEALSVLGFGGAAVELLSFTFPSAVRVGEPARLKAQLRNSGDEPAQALVEYRLHFLKKSGELRPTTFRFGRFELAPGETRTISKLHPFRVTGTRTYYPGDQAISVVVNGLASEARKFRLRFPG